jgi:hypothetical protein
MWMLPHLVLVDDIAWVISWFVRWLLHALIQRRLLRLLQLRTRVLSCRIFIKAALTLAFWKSVHDARHWWRSNRAGLSTTSKSLVRWVECHAGVLHRSKWLLASCSHLSHLFGWEPREVFFLKEFCLCQEPLRTMFQEQYCSLVFFVFARLGLEDPYWRNRHDPAVHVYYFPKCTTLL